MVSYVLPLAIVEVREYLDRGGRRPFAAWPRSRLLWHASNKAIFPTLRVLGPVFTSIGLILVQATGFTAAKMATGL